MFTLFAALVKEVRPGFYEEAVPAEGFFEVGGKTLFIAIVCSDFDEGSAGSVKIGEDGVFVETQCTKGEGSVESFP